MMETVSTGFHRRTEQQILKAVSFSTSFKGLGTVCVDSEKVKKLKASFQMGQGEYMSKTVDNPKQANDWLLSMLECVKSGNLAKSMRKTERELKPEIELSKAAEKMFAAGESGNISQVAEVDTRGFEVEAAQDVTSPFLKVARPASVDLCQSAVAVHKGSMNTFTTLASSDSAVYGVLFGKQAWNGKFHCTNIVVSASEPLHELMNNPKVIGCCRANSLSACGLVVTTAGSWWSGDLSKHEILAGLGSQGVDPLLVEVDFSTRPSGEIHCRELDLGTNEVRSVALAPVTQPHDVRKRLLYNLCWLDDLGVSHIEAATKKICDALIKNVLSSLESDQGPRRTVATKKYMRLEMPANGWCGWHALLASIDPGKWSLIQRNAGHTPRNRQVQIQEEADAKELRDSVCQKALANCDVAWYPSIRRVMVDPAFSPHDLEWICYICSNAVRVTCGLEA